MSNQMNIVYNGVIHLNEEQTDCVAISEPKKKKTEDMEAYRKEYREKHIQRLKNKDRVRFYRAKYNLTDAFIEKYGDYSADVFKLLLDYKKIKEKNAEIATSILSELI
jgi:hypothetical protein